MSPLLNKILAVAALSTSITVGCLEGYCAKCMRIEQNRAKEQAAHPQKAGYYEDFQASINTKGTSQASEIAFADDNSDSSDDSDEDDQNR